MIFVTGGAGFIGCNFIQDWLARQQEPVVNIDALTYAGNTASLQSVQNNSHYKFVRGDIGDRSLLERLFRQHQPRALVNFAAESHVDRSIDSPLEFVNTNVVGTVQLLESTRVYLDSTPAMQPRFRFLHISTDEVYGALSEDDPPFSEITPYAPNSAYSASKAASDHFVRAWHHTYGLPVVTTNCSNNYGPFQYPEKLIPLIISNALDGKALPVYGDGKQIRDWLYVKDHCDAIRAVLERGRLGETYTIGGNNELRNIDLVKHICTLLDKKRPRADSAPYSSQIEFVTDRPGHDRRYAINAGKIYEELGWVPSESFASGIDKTVEWYLANSAWMDTIKHSVAHFNQEPPA